MTTVHDDNVHAIALEGTFDDAQALVKAMFNHHAFRDRQRLSGVNSINWARIAAQAVYYFTAAVALGGPRRPVSFSVPTGNFGDVLAGYVARRMGLPIDRLMVATNRNDILARTLDTGRYEIGEVHATCAPSMDIQVSSNFERVLYDAHDRDPAAVRRLMSSLTQSRAFTLEAQPLARLRSEFDAKAVGEEAISREIARVLREAGYLLDPHTAIGLAAARTALARDPATPMVVLATAHPAKFPDAVEAACGIRPALPPHLADLFERQERFTVLRNDQSDIEAFIADRSRAGRTAQ
jgi:threonine synthase